MIVPNIPRTIKNLQRLRFIVNVFVKHGFGHIVDRINLSQYAAKGLRILRLKEAKRLERISLAERLRLAFEELGPTFVKLGQILSIRPDIMSEDFIEELKKLQNVVPPFPFEQVGQIVKEDLGAPIEEVFNYFETKPFAAASIAQVHLAKLKNGRDVVVKVRRPAIDKVIATDLNILFAIAKLLEKYVPESRLYDPTGLIREFAKSINRELDFTSEGINTETFLRNFETNPKLKIPKVYWKYSSRRVITLEHISGIKIDDLKALDALGIDRKELAESCVDMFFNQVFTYGLFHADLHPGNMFVYEDGSIGLVDFGMVGRMSGETLRNISAWFAALLNKDVDQIVKIYLKMGILGETDLMELKIEMADFLDRYSSTPLERIRLSQLIDEIITASLRHKIRLPSVFLMLGKAIITLESVVMNLDPKLDLMFVAKPYATKLILQQVDPVYWVKGLYGAINDLADLAKEMPFQLNQLLQKLQRGKLQIGFDLIGQEEFISEIHRSNNRIVLGLIVACLTISSAIIMALDDRHPVFGYPLLGILFLVLAAVFGFGLIISIARSGKI